MHIELQIKAILEAKLQTKDLFELSQTAVYKLKPMKNQKLKIRKHIKIWNPLNQNSELLICNIQKNKKTIAGTRNE